MQWPSTQHRRTGDAIRSNFQSITLASPGGKAADFAPLQPKNFLEDFLLSLPGRKRLITAGYHPNPETQQVRFVAVLDPMYSHGPGPAANWPARHTDIHLYIVRRASIVHIVIDFYRDAICARKRQENESNHHAPSDHHKSPPFEIVLSCTLV